jgi:hypothetical protein
MSAEKSMCAAQILRMRIGFALRRATGVVFDVDAMLSRPQLRSRRLEIWRAVGSDELNSLLDQLETQFGTEEAGQAERDAQRHSEPAGL